MQQTVLQINKYYPKSSTNHVLYYFLREKREKVVQTSQGIIQTKKNMV